MMKTRNPQQISMNKYVRNACSRIPVRQVLSVFPVEPPVSNLGISLTAFKAGYGYLRVFTID